MTWWHIEIAYCVWLVLCVGGVRVGVERREREERRADAAHAALIAFLRRGGATDETLQRWNEVRKQQRAQRFGGRGGS